jgi:hypothetical protein
VSPAGWALESAPHLDGPWTPVTRASSTSGSNTILDDPHRSRDCSLFPTAPDVVVGARRALLTCRYRVPGFVKIVSPFPTRGPSVAA